MENVCVDALILKRPRYICNTLMDGAFFSSSGTPALPPLAASPLLTRRQRRQRRACKRAC